MTNRHTVATVVVVIEHRNNDTARWITDLQIDLDLSFSLDSIIESFCTCKDRSLCVLNECLRDVWNFPFVSYIHADNDGIDFLATVTAVIARLCMINTIQDRPVEMSAKKMLYKITRFNLHNFYDVKKTHRSIFCKYSASNFIQYTPNVSILERQTSYHVFF